MSARAELDACDLPHHRERIAALCRAAVARHVGGGTRGIGRSVLADVDRTFSVDLSAFGGGIIRGPVQDLVVRETVSSTLDCYYRVFSDANSTGTFIGFKKIVAPFEQCVRVSVLLDM